MKTQEPRPPVEVLSPEEIIAKAAREVAEAEALEATLEQRVIEGDETVGPEQVEAARGMRKFALLRKQAAERKAAALAEKLAAAEFDAFLTEHAPYLTGRDEKLEALLVQARALIDQALEISTEYDRHIAALAVRADTVGNEWHPETDPRLIGSPRPFEYAWAAVDGVRAEVLTAGGVLQRLLAPYASAVSPFGPYSALREFLR